MNPILQAIIYGCTLAVDATTVSITNGLVYQGITKKRMVFSAIVFGIMQGVMPLLGYFLFSLTHANEKLDNFIQSIDHWIAFALLMFLGIKMIIDGIKDLQEQSKEDGVEIEKYEENLPIKKILIQGIATSIDAFAIGILLYTNRFDAVDERVSIWALVSIIAVITFLLSLLGAIFGKRIGRLFQKFAPFIGGIVIIIIGISIVVEHLG